MLYAYAYRQMGDKAQLSASVGTQVRGHVKWLNAWQLWPTGSRSFWMNLILGLSVHYSCMNLAFQHGSWMTVVEHFNLLTSWPWNTGQGHTPHQRSILLPCICGVTFPCRAIPVVVCKLDPVLEEWTKQTSHTTAILFHCSNAHYAQTIGHILSNSVALVPLTILHLHGIANHNTNSKP